MRQETFTLNAKELQRVAVISRCVKGELACARAAELLKITPRHVKRLKARYRLGSAAALAHASRGRPSRRRLSETMRARILKLARTTYAGFNDHHMAEKLVEVEGFSLAARPSVVCSAALASARPANAARLLIASVVFARGA